jgi:glycosyltransferase involved in cell wall biosynthesis
VIAVVNNPQSVAVIIPAWNEEQSVGKVIADLPKEICSLIIVADNNSTDRTAQVAREAGAIVVPATRQGYGSACLAGLAYLEQLPAERRPRVVAFIDGDFADDPRQLPKIVGPILEETADLVIGSRMLHAQPAGALTPQARFGNWLACRLMRILFKQRYTDLGPFRAISWEAMAKLKMRDPDFGWTVEMQIKAAKQRLKILETPVDYRPRIGQSKISGTIGGSIRAGYKIIVTIFRYW